MFEKGKILFAGLLVFMYPFFAPDVILAQVAVENTATYLGDNRWRWKIFIAEDNETLNRMSYVEYMLHPTFPNPHRIV